MIRPQIRELIELGPFPASSSVDLDVIKRQGEVFDAIAPPVSDEEARELLKLFGPDDFFGLSWSLLHLIESAPNWPLMDCLQVESNEWIVRLKESAQRKARAT